MNNTIEYKHLSYNKNEEKEKGKSKINHDLFPKKLYMLVEMAIALVTTAKNTIIVAMILSLLVDMPCTSL